MLASLEINYNLGALLHWNISFPLIIYSLNQSKKYIYSSIPEKQYACIYWLPSLALSFYWKKINMFWSLIICIDIRKLLPGVLAQNEQREDAKCHRGQRNRWRKRGARLRYILIKEPLKEAWLSLNKSEALPYSFRVLILTPNEKTNKLQ